MTSFLPTVITPDDVRAYKDRLDPFARAIDRGVSVSRLDAYTRRAWSDFFRSWRSFCDAEPSWLHAAAEFNAAEHYEEHIIHWQARLAPYCPIPGPLLTRPVPKAPAPASSVENTVKTVAVAGAVIALALSLRSVVRP
jgi:hypothetical protein